MLGYYVESYMLCVIILSVVMLSVVMLSVIAPILAQKPRILIFVK